MEDILGMISSQINTIVASCYVSKNFNHCLNKTQASTLQLIIFHYGEIFQQIIWLWYKLNMALPYY